MSEDFNNIPALQSDTENQSDTYAPKKLTEDEKKIIKIHHMKYDMIKTGNPKYLDKYVDDPDELVRKCVATYGGPKYGIKLIHDPSSDVRIEVAKHSDRNVATLLINDPNDTVKKYAKRVLQSNE